MHVFCEPAMLLYAAGLHFEASSTDDVPSKNTRKTDGSHSATASNLAIATSVAECLSDT